MSCTVHRWYKRNKEITLLGCWGILYRVIHILVTIGVVNFYFIAQILTHNVCYLIYKDRLNWTRDVTRFTGIILRKYQRTQEPPASANRGLFFNYFLHLVL
jgi:hypothetical protein